MALPKLVMGVLMGHAKLNLSPVIVAGSLSFEGGEDVNSSKTTKGILSDALYHYRNFTTCLLS